MEQIYPLVRSVCIFFLLVLLIQIFKRRGIFTTSHLPVFGRLITELILPITIFSTLSVGKIDVDLLNGAGIYLAASLLTCFIAYLICRICKFSDAVSGAIVVLAGFGSTSTIAYPLILQTYGANSEAMTSALIIGEFGSCIPFFTLGILILTYFGRKSKEQNVEIATIIYSFIRTPVFFSLVAGIIVSQIPFLSGLMTTDFVSEFFSYFNNGFEMLVAITVGLMLRPVKIHDILRYVAIAVPLSVIIMPLMVYGGAVLVGVPAITREILLIEAAVPSGAVAAVMAERHGCDGSLASILVIVSFLVSLITLPTLSFLLL